MGSFVELSGMLQGISETGSILCLLITMSGWKVNAANANEDYDPNHVRTWTGWYNTDKPSVGEPNDDESVSKIRMRGYEICLGHDPVGAMCRDAADISVTFSSDTQHIAADTLFLPCNKLGLVCKNTDQRSGNRTCRDYEIKFECQVPRISPPPENLGIIGVAAGLSVLVPILCVAILHIIRLYRARQRHNAGNYVLNTEQAAQTEHSDLPPSYSVLFGEATLNSSPSSASFAISISDSGADIQISSNQTTLHSIPEDQILTTHSDDSQLITFTAGQSRRMTSWRRRFPNMHLSIYEIFTLNGQSSTRIPSPAPSYLCTPPPTYKDAILIIGSSSNKTDDSSETEEKTDQ